MKKALAAIMLALCASRVLATLDYFGDVEAHRLKLTVTYSIMDADTRGRPIAKQFTGLITLTNGAPVLTIAEEKYECKGTVRVIMYNGMTKDDPTPKPHGKLLFDFQKSGWGDGVFITQHFEIPFTTDAKDPKAMLSISGNGTYELRDESELTRTFNYTMAPEPVPCEVTVQENTLGVMNKLRKTK